MSESNDQTVCTDIDATDDSIQPDYAFDELVDADCLSELEHVDSEFTEDQIKDHTGVTEDRTHTSPPTLTVETSTPIVPDGGWGWLIVLGSFLVHLVMGGFERSNGVLYLQLLSKYDQSATATSWVLSLFSTLRLALGPLASALCNKYSCRTVVIMGAVISTLGTLISAYVPDLPYLYLTYGVLGGVGRAFAYTPSLIIVGYYFNKKRGIAVGLSTSGVGIGCFVFPPVFEFLFNFYGFSGSFLILSALMSHFFICGCLFRSIERHQKFMAQDRKIASQTVSLKMNGQEDKLLPAVTMTTVQPQYKLQNCDSEKTSSTLDITANAEINGRRSSVFRRKFSQIKTAMKGSQNKTGGKKKPLLELHLFRNFAFSTLCVQLFLFTLSLNSTFVFLPALAKSRGISAMEGAYLVSILGIFDGISRIIMSSLLDMKKIKPYRLWLYNGVMFLLAIVSLCMPSMTSFYGFAIMSALYGVLSGTYISQKSVVVVDVLGVEKLSSSFGLLLLFQGLSALIGPTIGGIFKDLLGSYDMAFYFGSIGIVAGGLTMASGNIWLYRKQKQSEEKKKEIAA